MPASRFRKATEPSAILLRLTIDSAAALKELFQAWNRTRKMFSFWFFSDFLVSSSSVRL